MVSPQPDKGWGFYMQNDAGNRTNNGTLSRPTQISPEYMDTIYVDLKMIRPSPYKLGGLAIVCLRSRL